MYNVIEVELPIRPGTFTGYRILTNSEYYGMITRSEPAGAKVRGQEGNNPDHQLRSPNVC